MSRHISRRAGIWDENLSRSRRAHLRLMQSVKHKLTAYLSGRDESPDPAIYSWASHAIYLEACRIANIGSLPERRSAIDGLPETIRDRVKSELARVWSRRKDLKRAYME